MEARKCRESNSSRLNFDKICDGFEQELKKLCKAHCGKGAELYRDSCTVRIYFCVLSISHAYLKWHHGFFARATVFDERKGRELGEADFFTPPSTHPNETLCRSSTRLICARSAHYPKMASSFDLNNFNLNVAD